MDLEGTGERGEGRGERGEGRGERGEGRGERGEEERSVKTYSSEGEGRERIPFSRVTFGAVTLPIVSLRKRTSKVMSPISMHTKDGLKMVALIFTSKCPGPSPGRSNFCTVVPAKPFIPMVLLDYSLDSFLFVLLFVSFLLFFYFILYILLFFLIPVMATVLLNLNL